MVWTQMGAPPTMLLPDLGSRVCTYTTTIIIFSLLTGLHLRCPHRVLPPACSVLLCHCAAVRRRHPVTAQQRFAAQRPLPRSIPLQAANLSSASQLCVDRQKQHRARHNSDSSSSSNRPLVAASETADGHSSLSAERCARQPHPQINSR